MEPLVQLLRRPLDPRLDPSRHPLPYDSIRSEIFKGWNRLIAGKPNALALTPWRWKPHACDLPRIRGDALNKNMFVSMVSTFKRVAGPVKKRRPVGADGGLPFWILMSRWHITGPICWFSMVGGELEVIYVFSRS